MILVSSPLAGSLFLWAAGLALTFSVCFDGQAATVEQETLDHGDKSLPDAEVSARLSEMIRNFGKDDRTSPLAIVDSGFASGILIAQLTEARTRMFFRLSNEALGDVKVTNALINALRYRGK